MQGTICTSIVHCLYLGKCKNALHAALVNKWGKDLKKMAREIKTICIRSFGCEKT